MRIGVTGADGQLGRELCRQIGVDAIAWDLPGFDITNRDEIQRVLLAARPEAIINCAAYTQVDKAEREPGVCRAVNAEAVRILADVARRLDCALVQVSTDYVFGGDTTRDRPYAETDPTAPQGVYAQTKLEGERFAAAWEKSFVVRTSGLYGVTPRRNNFVEAMLRLAGERDELGVVNDQHCGPTFVGHLARAIRFLVQTTAYGTYHIVNSGSTTWYGFAREIFSLSGLDVVVKPITTAQFGAPAPRPAYSVLDTSKYHGLGGPPMPSWGEALSEYLHVRGVK